MAASDDRDDAILEHVRRYHLTTTEVLHRKFFPESDPAAVRKVVARLVRERRLHAFDLFDNRKYYVLTPREAVARGEHRCLGLGFNFQGLVNVYAVLCFCQAQGVDAYTAKEFRSKFSDLYVHGMRSGNFFRERRPEQNRLGFILVDYGKNPKKIVRKVSDILTRCHKHLIFDQMIHRGLFLMAVLTSSEPKRQLIRKALEEGLKTTTEIRVELVPELQDILVNRGKIPRRPRGTARAKTPSGEPLDNIPEPPEGT